MINQLTIADVLTLTVTIIVFLGGVTMTFMLNTALRRISSFERELTAIIKSAAANTANIDNLVKTVDNLRELIQTHMIANRRK